MSEVRETTTIRRLRNGKEVTVKMECNVGDPFQDYRGEGENGQALVSPDWAIESNQPIFWANIYTNLLRIIYTDDQWTYNVTKLIFGPDGLSTNKGLEGVFKRITHNEVPALKIVKNLASKENQDNDSIGLDCAIKVAGIDDRAQGQMTIQIGRVSADVYKGRILSPDNNGYTIRDTGGSIKLRGQLYHGGSVVPNGEYSVDWKKIVNGQLQPLTTGTGSEVSDGTDHIITVTADMVDSALNVYALFKDKNGAVLTSDTQGVVDASDPMHIAKNAVPANETIVYDSDTVVYTPSVLNSKGEKMSEFDGKFKFAASKEDGTPITLDNDHSTVATTSQTITANDVDKAEPGSLQLEIIANDKF